MDYGGSHYILVEVLPSVRYEELYKGLRRLASGGYTPILAHMERYRCLYKETDRLDELRDLGVCLQVNGASLFGGVFDSASAVVRKLCKSGGSIFWGQIPTALIIENRRSKKGGGVDSRQLSGACC